MAYKDKHVQSRQVLQTHHHEEGLGLSINFPVSSQDMLKSVSTCRALEATIEGHTTRLWIPVINSKTGKKENCLS